MINVDTTEQVIAGLEKGIEAGEFVRFDAAAGEEQLDLDSVDLDANAETEQEAAPGNTASEKQLALIKKLVSEKDADTMAEWGRDLWRAGYLTGGREGTASKLIDRLLAAPFRETRESKSEAPEGMHKLDGNIYKVQRAVHGSGKLYAKKLSLTQYIEDGQAKHDGEFVYAPGVARQLSEDTVLSLEAAKEYGAMYGTCVRCGRTLTDENSIQAGIGPICASRF